MKHDLSAPMAARAGTEEPASSFSRRAHQIIPGGAHTYSKGDDQFPLTAPRGFVRARGARIWDLDDVEFVDWGMGINSVLVGHAEETIDDAAIAALRTGQNFSRPSLREVEAAEALLAMFPGMDMVKFAKNGSDANTAAISLARAVTGRDLVAYDASAPFLSIHDWFIGTTPMNAGVPEVVRRLSLPFTYNDLPSLERLFERHPKEIAVVIMEVCREDKPRPGFLEGIRSLCDEQGALLIFDEIVTGFRYGLRGAHALFGVLPDLISLGKGMANGYSLTALIGKRQYMERGGIRHRGERVFLLSTTNGAEQSGLAAGIATWEFYRRHPVIEHLAAIGSGVMEDVSAAARRHGISAFLSAWSDFPCRPMLRFLGPDKQASPEYRTLFLQEMARHGVFMPWICPSFAHGAPELTQTAAALDEACRVYAAALEAGSVDRFLIGPPAKPVFRKYN